METIITVTAKLLDKNSLTPFLSDGAIVKLYDQDIFEDDFLGQSRIQDDGSISISFVPSDFSSIDSPGEKYPDLYFTVFKYGKLLYKSAIFKNVDFNRYAVSEPLKGLTFDLGTFVIG